MITDLKGFAENYRHEPNWGDIWTLDGLYLNDRQARIFVEKAIEAGYETDAEVPDSLVREWLGLPRKEGGNK